MGDKPKQTCGTRRGNGAGKGEGWGGPARGAGHRFVKGEVLPAQGKGTTAAYAEAREERNRLLKDHLFDLALRAERQETQVSAAIAWLDRDEGKPIARTVTATVDDVSQLTDLELAAEIARVERELAQAQAGAGEAAAGKPSGDVPPIH